MQARSCLPYVFAFAHARGFLTRHPRVPLMTPMTHTMDRGLVHRALVPEQKALDELLTILVHTLYFRVACVLRRRSAAARGRDVKQELEDIVQDVLLRLFEDDGRILRNWNPERGLSLERFVGLVAERHIASMMRSQRRNPWMEDPTLAELLNDREDLAPSVELRLASRELCELILDRLRERLSPLAFHLFFALIVEAREVEIVANETNLPKRAMYNWKNRLLKTVREVADEIENENPIARAGGVKP